MRNGTIGVLRNWYYTRSFRGPFKTKFRQQRSFSTLHRWSCQFHSNSIETRTWGRCTERKTMWSHYRLEELFPWSRAQSPCMRLTIRYDTKDHESFTIWTGIAIAKRLFCCKHGWASLDWSCKSNSWADVLPTYASPKLHTYIRQNINAWIY